MSQPSALRQFHINKKGVTTRCSAQSEESCPFNSRPHFKTREEAQTFYENEQSDDVLSGHKKPTVSKGFDPSRESLFSNPRARQEPTIAVAVIKAETKKTLDGILTIQRLNSKVNLSGAENPELKAAIASSKESSIRVNGMLKEFSYLVETNESFKNKAKNVDGEFLRKAQASKSLNQSFAQTYPVR